MGKKVSATFVIIVACLTIFSVLGLVGATAWIMGVNKVEVDVPNTNHEFKFNGKLYFYDGDREIGSYKCKTSSCDYAKVTYDDSKYSLNSFVTSELKNKLINNKYVFIEDGGVVLYDIVNGSGINYKAVKNYDVPLAGNYFILQDSTDDTWGVIKITSIPSTVINYKYDFIGVNKTTNEDNTLSNNLFVVKDNNGWKIVNSNDVDQSKYFINEIYDYNENFVITKTKDNYYYLNSLGGDQLFSYNFVKMDFIGKYIEVINSNNQYYLINPLTLREASNRYNVTSPMDVVSNITMNGVEITVFGQLQETVSLD